MIRKTCRRHALSEPLESRVLFAAELVRDVNPATADLAGSVLAADLDGQSWVVWSSQGLYRTNGTAAGTTLLRTGLYGDGNNAPQFTRVGNQVFFSVKQTSSTPGSLWKTDGTVGGTVQIATGATGTSGFGSLANCNGQLYYGTSVNTSKSQLWRTDGTAGGATLVKEFTSWYYPGALTVYNGTIYFASGNDTAEGAGLWRTDGTAGGTVFVKAIASSSQRFTGSLNVAGGLMYFTAADNTNGEEPWRSDGTAAGTTLLRNIVSGSGSSFPKGYAPLPGSPNVAMFIASGNLYRTDGTSANTVRVNPPAGTSISSLDEMIGFGNAVYFTAFDGNGEQLWRTDGTSAGTARVKQIPEAGGSGSVQNLVAAGSQMFFQARDADFQTKLWVSDGTTGGTRLAAPSLASTAPFIRGTGNVAGPGGAAGNRVLFTADHPLAGVEVHVSDGTDAGTGLVADLATTPLDGNPGGNYPASNYWANLGAGMSATLPNGLTIFATSSYTTTGGGIGAGLWATNGTIAGTTLLRQNFNTGGSGDERIRYMTAVGNYAYFVLEGPATYRKYRTDGTAAGTVELTGGSIPDAAYHNGGTPFVTLNGHVYYLGGNGLWRDNIATGVGESVAYVGQSEGFLTAAGNQLFFRAGLDTELWVSDGTAAGTRQIPLNPDTSGSDAGSFPDEIVAIGNTVYFTAEDNASTWERGLWRSDGTVAGTVQIARGILPTYAGTSNYRPAYLTVFGDALYFSGYSAAAGFELWRSDGTPAGTTIVKDINTATTGNNSSSPRWITAANGRLYFAAYTQATGMELWTSDGTAAGTAMLADIKPGAAGGMDPDSTSELYDERPIVAAGYGAFVAADDGVNGRQLWQTRGTPDTTRRVDADAPAGTTAPTAPRVMGFATVNTEKYVLFSARHPSTGRELWRAPAAELFEPPVVPAAVTDVFVAGTGWSANFLNHLQATGQGDATYGFRIDPAAAPDELPWVNLNKVSIRFNQGVNLTAGDLIITGVNVANYGSGTFAYDPATFTATWTLATAGVANEKLALNLAAHVTAAPFRGRLNVLPGDANRSGGSVIGSDVTLVRNAQNASPGAAGSLYTIFKDVNGSATIVGSDVTAVRNRQGLSLPAGEPGTPSIVVQKMSVPMFASAPAAPITKRRDDLLGDVFAASR